ncbi:MucB/RseB C-terminal domain-containing protein [Simiduia litorea]|uniref:MucB/RseB C-terminal domain-containing protein n=1 Tax=Simiduia litorea TaxID=1435348 RepID=UPI0036F3A3D6
MIVRFRKAGLLADFIVLVFLSLTQFPTFADDAIDGRKILARQSIAMSQASYSGLLTYEHGTHLSTIEIQHQVIEGVEHESLVHLSGEAREIRRNSDHNHCPFPGEQLIRGAAPQAVQITQDINDFYHISILGFERIAGRQSVVVQVMPRDQHRYGYIVSVDKESYLALKTLLIGPGAKVIERFQFSKIVIDASLPFAIERGVIDNKVDGCQLIAAQPVNQQWYTQWLPPGFVFAGEKTLSDERLMLKYTDGLSAFSIFIDQIDSPSIIEGRAQRGATVAYLGRLESTRGNYRVTAVGEVPAPTLERVAMSLREKL